MESYKLGECDEMIRQLNNIIRVAEKYGSTASYYEQQRMMWTAMKEERERERNEPRSVMDVRSSQYIENVMRPVYSALGVKGELLTGEKER